MKIRKSDMALIRESEESGLMASMTSIVEHNRTELNNELSSYFRSQMPSYKGSFDEEECEDVLYGINAYLKENGIDKHPLKFPLSSGTNVYLVPVCKNIQAKVLVSDEYFGDGDYSKYVDISYFTINENTTKEDVNILIHFLNMHVL